MTILTVVLGVLVLILSFFLGWFMASGRSMFHNKVSEKKVSPPQKSNNIDSNKDIITPDVLKNKIKEGLKSIGINEGVEVKVASVNPDGTKVENLTEIPAELMDVLNKGSKEPMKHYYKSFEIKEVNLKEKFEEEEESKKNDRKKLDLDNLLGNNDEDDE